MENTEVQNNWLLPRTDVVFKILFGKHPHVLKQFLQCVLDLKQDEYKSIKLLDTNQRFDPESKLTILDLKIETFSGDIIDVEMQLLPMRSIVKRILYYLSQMIVEQLQPSQTYSSLKRVITIFIMDRDILQEDNRPNHRFRFVDREADIELSNLMEVNILELEKARQKKTIDSPLDVWLKFLAASTKEEFMEYAAQDAGVKEACAILENLSANDQIRREAEARIKAWRDEQDRLEGAREEGLKEGMKEGKENERKNIARKMLSLSMPLDSIVTVTGLSHDQISLLL